MAGYNQGYATSYAATSARSGSGTFSGTGSLGAATAAPRTSGLTAFGAAGSLSATSSSSSVPSGFNAGYSYGYGQTTTAPALSGTIVLAGAGNLLITSGVQAVRTGLLSGSGGLTATGIAGPANTAPPVTPTVASGTATLGGVGQLVATGVVRSGTVTAGGPTANVVHRPLTPWLKDPADPGRNLALSCLEGLTWTRARGQAVLQVLGRPDPVVQTDVRRSRTGTLTATAATQDELDQLDSLLEVPTVLLLAVPPATAGWRGQNVYVVATGDDSNALLGDVPFDYRTVSVPVTEVRRPATV